MIAIKRENALTFHPSRGNVPVSSFTDLCDSQSTGLCFSDPSMVVNCACTEIMLVLGLPHQRLNWTTPTRFLRSHTHIASLVNSDCKTSVCLYELQLTRSAYMCLWIPLSLPASDRRGREQCWEQLGMENCQFARRLITQHCLVFPR